MNTITKHNDPIPGSTFPHPKLQHSSNMLDEKLASATISTHMYLFLNQTVSHQSHACSATTTTVPAMLEAASLQLQVFQKKDEVCFINSLM